MDEADRLPEDGQHLSRCRGVNDRALGRPPVSPRHSPNQITFIRRAPDRRQASMGSCIGTAVRQDLLRVERADRVESLRCGPPDRSNRRSSPVGRARPGPRPPRRTAFVPVRDGRPADAAGCTVLAWPLDRIVVENLRHRDPSWSFAQEGPWQHRLCFADNGAGNDFFIDMTRSQPGVLVWSYVDGHAHVMAQSLDAFWAGWLSGTLTA